jgi:pimeloyl-ACP methyl ester carboxylesterase
MRERSSAIVGYEMSAGGAKQTFQGREDRITPFAVAEEYFDKVRSNGKTFVPIEGGHFACFTNPAVFVGALNKRVRPLAV